MGWLPFFSLLFDSMDGSGYCGISEMAFRMFTVILVVRVWLRSYVTLMESASNEILFLELY